MKGLGTRALVFLTGCFVYSFLEIASRGFTHWTMTLTGGFVLTIIYEMHVRLKNTPLWQKCLLGSLIITSVEFTIGVIVNIVLNWHVWDYSDMPLNILGQICLPFTVLWFFLCIPANFVCKGISRRLEE
ncbi:putative ABC transporter permease [Porcipelethomonas sp.]|uniref:putative ABC transporter permease n=1 Tax=Porcipelethomonas sp. TaxID=2981675 RepID=UPI003EFA9364